MAEIYAIIDKGFIVLFFFGISQKNKSYKNQKYTTYYGGEIECIFYCPVYHDLIPFIKKTAGHKNTNDMVMPKTGIFVVCKKVSGLVNKGVIIPAENQAEDITFKKSARILN
jgi:hypothetical protein